MSYFLFKTSSLIATGLFIGTAVGFHSFSLWLLNHQYITTLYKLFKPAKLSSSRHIERADMVEIFRLRKRLFQEYTGKWLRTRTLFIHVVGTKGKGSTCEFLRVGCMRLKVVRSKGNLADAECSQGERGTVSEPGSTGSRVGVFTSPHMHTARERVKVGGKLISKTDMIRCSSAALSAFEHTSWSVFFDYLCFVALMYFEEQRVDISIMEAGIGGRFDSTNFIEDAHRVTEMDRKGDQQRLWVVISNISVDHQSMLGSTIEEIAWQKCGAIKCGSHVFTCSSTQQPVVMEIIRAACKEQGATLHEVVLPSSVIGDTVEENRRVAAAVVDHLCSSGTCVQVSDLSSEPEYFWPCRMDKFRVPTEAGNAFMILDGCHNGYSVSRFMKRIHSTAEGLLAENTSVASSPAGSTGRPFIHTLFGVGMEKKENVVSMLSAVTMYSDRVSLVKSEHFRAMGLDVLQNYVPTGEINKIVESASVIGRTGSNIEGTMEQVLSSLAEKGETQNTIIIVCGSLFVASEARECLFRKFPQLFSADDWVRDKEFLGEL